MHGIYCVASHPGVPSVAPCRDGHLDGCPNPDDHPPCRARLAERGFLCARHFDRLEHAYARWNEFEDRVNSLGLSKAVQRDNAGVRTQADGHVNLTGVMLAIDECSRFLASAAGHPSLEMWVSTEAGAADAIQFAAAAERAYRSHETAERPHKIKRVRCECGAQLIWRPPAWFEGDVTVQCSVCEKRMTQDEFEGLEQAS